MKSILTILLFGCSFFVNTTFAEDYVWQKLNTEPYQGKQDDIFFINEQNGWYVNGDGKIYRTRDGGTNWEKIFEQKGTFFRCITFIDSLHGFVGNVGTEYFPGVTDTITVYQTSDGGNSWVPTKYNGSYVKGLCAIDVVKEEFVNHGEIGYKNHIYGVGRVGSPANILISHDDGVTFTSHSMEAYCDAMYDIKMFDKYNGFACASVNKDLSKSHARIIQTKDGGKTWKTVYESKRPFEITWKMFFPSEKIGYATIQSYNPDSTVSVQHFIKTIDGGKHWTEHELCNDFKARSFGVGFINDEVGFIGTTYSGYYTKDGGKSWEKTDLGIACNKIRIVHTPDNKVYGYAIGMNVYKLMEK